MQSQWTDWLRELAAAGQGGSNATIKPITRGLPYSLVLAIASDVSADAFAAELLLSPDADATALATFTVTIGAYSGGYTNVTLALSQAQVAAITASDADFDGLTEVVFNLFHTPSGGAQYRLLGSNIVIAE